MATLAVLVVCVGTAWFAMRGDWSPLQWLGIPTLSEPYGDARTISGAAIALERGLDPLWENPGDPWGRPMDYPRVWLLLPAAGIGPQQTGILVAMFFLAALAGGLALRRLPRDHLEATAMALGIVAPTTWLALERANNDLLLFGLCCAAGLAAARRTGLAASLIAGAATLKLYPIAGAAALLRPDLRASRRTLVPLLLAFAGYVAWTFRDVLQMQAGATRAEWLSYGVGILPLWLAKNSAPGRGAWLTLAFAIMLGAVALALRWRARARLGRAAAAPALSSFRLGAAIYLGTFALGQSFDYRLLFLLPAIPQLVRWSRDARGPARTVAATTLTSVLFLLWSLTWRSVLQPILGRTLPLAIDEALAWSTWFGMAALLVLSLPEWCVPRKWHGSAWIDEGRLEAAGLDDSGPGGEQVAPSRRRPARRAGS